jgi:3-dehydroquinate synthase
VAIKAEVVSQDERESGLRAILNFGHTVGHAIETLSGYDLLHGEAVAIGMAVESRLAEDTRRTSEALHARVTALLEKYGLPVSVPEHLTTDRIIEAMQGDKKARAGRTRFVLPSAIGEVAQSGDGAWTVEVEERVIRQVLDSAR